MSEPGGIRVAEVVGGVIAVVLFVALYGIVLIVFEAEDAGAASSFSTADASKPDKIDVDARLVSIDPVKGDLSARLNFTPSGKLLAEDGIALAKTLVLDVNSSTGKTQYVFKKGEPMNPTDVVVSLYDGSVTDYPFDSHSAELAFSITEQAPEAGKEPAKETIKPPAPQPADEEEGDEGEPKPPAAQPAKAAEPEDEGEIPTIVSFSGALTGYSTKATESQYSQATSGFTDIEIEISRSATVWLFALFIMALQWLLALGALFVAFSVLVRGRKVELAMFSWLAALLFAMVPLRSAMPGAPPIGALSDVLAFFWAEMLIALSLVLIVFTWLRRPGAK
jgi:hypothetical protein